MKFVIFIVFYNLLIAFSQENPSGGLESIVRQLNTAQKTELDAIKTDKSLTKGQFQQKIRDFLHKLPEKLQKPAIDVALKIDQLRSKALKNVKADAEGLGEEAKKAIDQILAVKYNMDITQAQEREQVAAIKRGLSDEAKEELRGVLNKLKKQMFDDYVAVIFH